MRRAIKSCVALAVLIGAAAARAQLAGPGLPPGTNCSAPIVITLPAALPYNQPGTTCGMGNDYSGTCLAPNDGSQDTIYQLTVTEPVCISITLASNGLPCRVAMDDSCPPGDAGGCLFTLNTGGATATRRNVQLTPGAYYLLIDANATYVCGTFTLSITSGCLPLACCFADSSCQFISAPDCAAAGGNAQAEGSLCQPNMCPARQACCMSTGGCQMLPPYFCQQAAGFSQGLSSNCANLNCPAAQACCFADGSCSALITASCSNAHGNSLGAGSVCTPNPCPAARACCYFDGSCANLVPISCTGLAQAEGSTCEPNLCEQPQACCTLVGACTMRFVASCNSSGGAPQGPGSTCNPNICPTACIIGDANCDGRVDNFDIDPFIQALIGQPIGSPECMAMVSCWGDLDRSGGSLNLFDIDPFVNCIVYLPPVGQSCPH